MSSLIRRGVLSEWPILGTFCCIALRELVYVVRSFLCGSFFFFCGFRLEFNMSRYFLGLSRNMPFDQLFCCFF